MQRLPKSIVPETLRLLLTRNDGQVIGDFDARPSDTDVKVAKTYRVQGKVTLDGQPLSDCFIVLTSNDGQVRGEVADGKFDLRDVWGGVYNVHFQESDG